ncbi:unnamed protein product [Effrenium voratum]|nr:unnamed protein product [Effrenium voratum]
MQTMVELEKPDKEVKEKKEKKEKKDKKEKKEKKEKANQEGKPGKEKKEKKEKKHKDKDKAKKDKKDKKEKKKEKKHKHHHHKHDNDKTAVRAKPALQKAKTWPVAKKAKTAGEQKVLLKTEDDYEPVNRWWERADGAESGKRGAKKWDTFEHHGLLFAPDYEAHGIPLIYDGQKVNLPQEAEEIAYYWTSVKGTPYESKDIFIKNFWKTFKEFLPKDTTIKDFKKCDFSLMSEHREKERQKRLNRSKEEKESEKAKTAKDTEWYSHAIVNGVREKLGNFRLEPPQLFRGRGEHPKQGLLKKRTFPESVTINIGETACVPKVLGMPGHAWRDVVHENAVQWIATFEDGLLGDAKYVSFAATSGLKGQPDMLKYDRARRLVATIDKIRASYEKLQHSNNIVERQKATATYFIDKLALRVGGEKDTEEEADTVGCCSLRVEHLELSEPSTISLDFLGKDSIRYTNSVEVTPRVFENVKGFIHGKSKTDQVFDKITPSDLNEYFKTFMEDLSAKVFRTYNASFTLQNELSKFDMSKRQAFSQDQLYQFYNDANRQVAILCNHQKAESKGHAQSVEKMQKVVADLEKNYKQLKRNLHALQEGRPIKESATKLPKDLQGTKRTLGHEAKTSMPKRSEQFLVGDLQDTELCSSTATRFLERH